MNLPGLLQLNPKNIDCYTKQEDANQLVRYLEKNDLIREGMVIWLPFGDKGRAIDKALAKYKPIATDTDFYTTNQVCDIIISNPPFSGRTKLIKSLLSRGIPFIILQSITAFNNSTFRTMCMNHSKDISFVFPEKRMSFEGKKDTVSFYSFWFCYKINNLQTFNSIKDEKF